MKKNTINTINYKKKNKITNTEKKRFKEPKN